MSEHGELHELLPWYANGTLEPAESARVAAHLERCAECRAELAACRRLGERLRQTPAAAPAPHPVQLSRLLERLDRPPSEAEEPEPVQRRWPAVARWPAAARWLIAAQLAGLAVLGVAAGVRRTETPGFRTLSAPSVAVAGRTAARVVFAEGVSEREVRALLIELEAEIVAGPSPLGVYTLALPARLDGEPRDWLAEHLRSRPELMFVELVPAETGE